MSAIDWEIRFEGWLKSAKPSFSFPLEYKEVQSLQEALRAKNCDNLVKAHLEDMDFRLLARDGSAELTHEEAKQALRNVYLVACGQQPETQVG